MFDKGCLTSNMAMHRLSICRPIYNIQHIYHHQSVLLKGRSFTANPSTKAAVLPKGKSSTANVGTKVAVLVGMNRYDSFPLLSTHYSLFSILTDLKRSQGHDPEGKESGFG